MKADRYVRFLLTVIAVCFVLHILKEYDFIAPAQAAPTVAAGINQDGYVVDVRIVGGVGYNEKTNRWHVFDWSNR